MQHAFSAARSKLEEVVDQVKEKIPGNQEDHPKNSWTEAIDNTLSSICKGEVKHLESQLQAGDDYLP